ncbi:MAG: YfhO family protein [Patescibacteria group bacterium]
MEKRRNFVVLIVFILLIAVFFYRQIFLGQVFYCCDNLLINIPSKLFLVDELRQGRFPLWNPYIFSGSPFFADINLALLYPMNALYFILPPFQALTVGALLDIFVGLMGMYLLCRSLRCSTTASILGAVVFGFSGTMVTYINNIPMLQAASLAPWLLWGWKRLLQKPSIARYLGIVVIASLQVLAGHPQLTYYSWLLAVLFVLFACPGKLLQKIGLMSAVVLLTFFLTGVQVVPFMEFAMLSTRAGRGFAYASFDSLHPLNIVRLFIPNVVGVLRDGTAWAQGGSVYGYIGVLAVIFVFAARLRFWKIIAGVAFVLALGKYTPVFTIAYWLVPGIAGFRSPQHFLLPFTIAVSVLAAYGLDDVKKRAIRNIGVIGMMGGIGGGLLYLFSANLAGLVLELLVSYPTRVLEKLHGFSLGMIETVVQLTAMNILMVGILMVTAGLVWRKSRNAVVLLVFFELFLFSQNGLVSINQNEPMRWFAGMRGQEKSIVDPLQYPYLGKKEFGVFNWDRESAWQVSILRPNLNMVAGLPTPYGYASLVYREYQMYASSASADPTGVQLDDPTGGKVAMLTGPRLFFLDKKLQKHPVEIQSYTSNDVRLLTNRNEAGTVVFIDVNYPGWRVRVDGKESRIKTYEKVYKSVWVEKGSHEIRFTFFPQSFQVGLLMSGIGGVVSIALIFLAGQKVKKDKKHVRNGKRPHKLVDFTVVEL